MLPKMMREDGDGALATEVSEVTIALGGALDEAGIKLPQFAATAAADDFLVRLGDCNARTGMALCQLLQDGLKWRELSGEGARTHAG